MQRYMKGHEGRSPHNKSRGCGLLYFPLSVLLLFLSGYIKSFLSTSILHCFLKNAMASCHPFLFRPAIRSR